MTYKLLSISLLITTVFTVSGCGETKFLGGQVAPDELEVVDAPPLSLPPNFELRPPKEGEVMLVAPGNNEARDLILGNSIIRDANQPVKKLQIDTKKAPQKIIAPQEYEEIKSHQEKPQVDSWLVKKTGGQMRDENIRQEIQKDLKIEQVEENQGFFARKFGKKAREERARQRALETQEKYDGMLQTK